MDGRLGHILAHQVRGTRVALLAGAALLASACSSTPHDLPPRSKLNRYELQAIEPEIRRHSDCLARESASPEPVAAMTSRARARCARSLAQLRARLREFNLSEDAQRRYLGALEIASRNQALARTVGADALE